MTTTLDYAILAGRSYFDTRAAMNRFPIPDGWAVDLRVPEDKKTGFEATIFKNSSTNEIVISYAGSYTKSGADINADLTLYAGKYHAQLLQAAKYYSDIRLGCTKATHCALAKFTQAIQTALSKLGSVLALVVAACVCAPFPAIAADTWKEEVLLHDGQALLVERWTLRGGRSELGQQAPIKEESLEFVHPMTRQSITWASHASPDLGLADLAPIALQVVDATPYLVTYPVGCLAYNKWGRPNPPYVLFRYTASAWQRIELQQLPQALQKPNLLISSPDNEVRRLGTRNVSAAMVERVNGELTQREFHSILRVPFAHGMASCAEMTSNGKGAWVGIGWFRDQPSLDACMNYCSREKFDHKTCPCNKIFEEK